MVQGAVKGVHPVFSVIIVTYNSQEFIGDCIRSVEKAGNALRSSIKWDGNCEIWETIVVDNASTDRTVDVVQKFEGVKLISNRENVGFAAAVNRGVEEANGEWLFLLNPDCVLDEKAFIALLNFVQNCDEKVAVIGMQLLNPDGKLQPSGRRFPKVWEFVLALLGFHRQMEARWFAGRDFGKVQEVDEVSGAALAIKRKVFEQIGRMDEGFFLFFEELDLCRRVKASGWKVVYLPDVKVRHIWGGSIRKVPEIARRSQRESAIRYFRKHHSNLTAMVLTVVFWLRDAVRKVWLSVFHGMQRESETCQHRE